MDCAVDSEIDPQALPEKLRRALAYWLEIKGDKPLPHRSDFDPLDIPALLPHIILTEVVRGHDDDGFEDFRFRLVGTYIDDRVNEKYTGRNLSAIDGKGPGSEIWQAYCEVEKERRPKFKSLRYIGPMENVKQSWELYMPLSKTGERVDFIVVALLLG